VPALEALGWDAAREGEFRPFAAKGLVPGRISLEHNHIYRVLTADDEVLAEAAGRIRHRASERREMPAVGDWVALELETAGGRARISSILERRTWFSRKAAGRDTHEQVIAANVDVALLVFGLDKPVNPRAIERYLTVASRSRARSVVLLNKADMADDVADAVREAEAVSGLTPVHAVSARQPGGLEPLSAYLAAGRTIVFLGPSGVGKSTLVNGLLGEERLPTGAVRDWDQRGRHTSVHRQLVVRPAGGLIVDTPGMRELQPWDSEEELAEAFAEIEALAADCRFRDCGHDQEPGCAVKRAVDAGVLAAERYESYLKLRHEQAALDQQRIEKARKH
jgi:ribosome biogenesis GTPase